MARIVLGSAKRSQLSALGRLNDRPSMTTTCAWCMTWCMTRSMAALANIFVNEQRRPLVKGAVRRDEHCAALVALRMTADRLADLVGDRLPVLAAPVPQRRTLVR